MKVIYYLILALCFVKTFQGESDEFSDNLSSDYNVENNGNDLNYKIF